MSLQLLNNLDNYKSEYICSTTEVFKTYTGIITNFLVQCTENIYMQNIYYYKYVICKGLETISHVFKMLMLYTKNLSLTTQYCNQSIFYYIEFIGQIGDDHHSFLQLNSKDATLFVYKKSIFDLDPNFRKEFASSKLTQDFMNTIDILIKIYSEYFINNINYCKFENGNFLELLTKIDNKCSNFSQTILNLSVGIEENIFYNKLECLDLFINKIISYKLDNNLLLIELFSKKLKKNIITKNNLYNKLLVDNKINDLTNVKYINWLYN